MRPPWKLPALFCDFIHADGLSLTAGRLGKKTIPARPPSARIVKTHAQPQRLSVSRVDLHTRRIGTEKSARRSPTHDPPSHRIRRRNPQPKAPPQRLTPVECGGRSSRLHRSTLVHPSHPLHPAPSRPQRGHRNVAMGGAGEPSRPRNPWSSVPNPTRPGRGGGSAV